MIETFTKAAEIYEKAKEISSSFNPDKRIEKGDILSNPLTEEYNPDKKIEKSEYEIVAIHGVTGIPFIEKTVKNPDTGEIYCQRFPVFKSEFDAYLPEDLYKAKDRYQFAECNRQLKAAINENPFMAKQFDADQLDQIKKGETPDGFTWHHNEDDGKIQLVDSYIHAKTGHVGGKKFWGGGNANR